MDRDSCSEVGGWEGVAGAEQQHGLAQSAARRRPCPREVQHQPSCPVTPADSGHGMRRAAAGQQAGGQQLSSVICCGHGLLLPSAEGRTWTILFHCLVLLELQSLSSFLFSWVPGFRSPPVYFPVVTSFVTLSFTFPNFHFNCPESEELISLSMTKFITK